MNCSQWAIHASCAIFRAFPRGLRATSPRSIARPICRAFDQQLKSHVERYTGRLQVRCSYLLTSTSLPFFLFLPPSYFLPLAASFSRSHSPAFPTSAPFLSAPQRAGICEINARDRSPRITPPVETALICSHTRVTRS